MLVSFFPILVAFSIWEYRTEFFSLIKSQVYEVDLVVLVLSARENSARRQAIRDTWLKSLQDNASLNDQILVKFVVGDTPCNLPLEDRVDEHSCEKWSPGSASQSLLTATKSAVSDPINSEELVYAEPIVEFQVMQPIIVRKLGIYKKCLKSVVKVMLVDAFSSKDIASAEFSPGDPGVLEDGYYYKKVEEYFLPKKIEMYVEIGSTQNECAIVLHDTDNLYQTNNGSGVLRFYTTGRIDGHYAHPFKALKLSMPGVSFMYDVENPEDLELHKASQASRQSQIEDALAKDEKSLADEQLRYGDLLFVPVMDIYRNIPQKLLESFHSAYDTTKFKYLLKTDDDCYLDVEKILPALPKKNERLGQWWGHFRYNWAVENTGKWAESNYQAPAYPKFACGAGYVISKSIVKWLVENKQHLELFQGEDTSMGIWLAAVALQTIDDPLWQCESECISDMYSMPDLGAEKLHQLWKNKLACGDPCGCL